MKYDKSGKPEQPRFLTPADEEEVRKWREANREPDGSLPCVIVGKDFDVLEGVTLPSYRLTFKKVRTRPLRRGEVI